MSRLILPRKIFDEMLVHCRAGYPYEACGILAGRDGHVSEIYTLTNVEKSSVSYLLDSKEQFSVMKEIRQKNLVMLAIFHSHPHSAAYPSAKDVSLAFYEDAVYIIVSLMEREQVVKGYAIREGSVDEVELAVQAA